jgi:hypothetical protein
MRNRTEMPGWEATGHRSRVAITDAASKRRRRSWRRTRLTPRGTSRTQIAVPGTRDPANTTSGVGREGTDEEQVQHSAGPGLASRRFPARNLSMQFEFLKYTYQSYGTERDCTTLPLLGYSFYPPNVKLLPRFRDIVMVLDSMLVPF